MRVSGAEDRGCQTILGGLRQDGSGYGLRAKVGGGGGEAEVLAEEAEVGEVDLTVVVEVAVVPCRGEGVVVAGAEAAEVGEVDGAVEVGVGDPGVLYEELAGWEGGGVDDVVGGVGVGEGEAGGGGTGGGAGADAGAGP